MNVSIRIDTVHSLGGRETSGGDTSILKVPDQLMFNGAIVLPVASRFLRLLAEEQARDLGEVLHSAEWVLTNSKDELRARELHDCPRCRAGLKIAFDFLDEDPQHELLAGQLFWLKR